MKTSQMALTLALMGIFACSPPPPMTPITASKDGSGKTPAPTLDASQERGKEEPTAKKAIRAPVDLTPKRFKVIVTASFENLPSGSQILAPSPRDRHHQKVTKSDHSGSQGAVYGTQDGHNLVFLSESIKGEKARYRGEFHVEGRTMMAGHLEGLARATYAKFRYPREKAFAEAFAKKHGAPPEKPFRAITEAFDAAVALDEKDAWKVTLAFSERLTSAKIPHRVVQGLWLQGTTAIPHVWMDILVPRIGWAPFDPIAFRTATGDDKPYRGRHPADRIRAIFGTTFKVDLDSDDPAVVYTGRFGAPVALHQGKSVGTRALKVSVEKLP